MLPDGPEPVVFEVEYTPTEQLEPLEDAEAQSKVCSLRRWPLWGSKHGLACGTSSLQSICFCILHTHRTLRYLNN